MREKYVDERVGLWFIFGEGPNGVDVSDGQQDVFTQLPKPIAEAICIAQEQFRHKLYAILCGAKYV